MKNLVLPWLPYLVVISTMLGCSLFAVGLWRTYGKTPKRAWSAVGLTIAGILSLMAALFLYSLNKNSQQSRLNFCRTLLTKSVATALEMYAADHDGEYPTSLGDLTPNYLKFIPKCPAVDRDTYSATYRTYTTADGLGYRVSCGGTNHVGAGVEEADLPTHHSSWGSYAGDDSALRRPRYPAVPSPPPPKAEEER